MQELITLGLELSNTFIPIRDKALVEECESDGSAREESEEGKGEGHNRLIGFYSFNRFNTLGAL
jgi:hypothetical protein